MPDQNDEKASILVVDDRRENLLVFQTMLEELDQNIVTARSGEEALKRMLEREFAVVLLDVNMPGMDGLETASYIRGRQKTAHTPIIFLTAYAEEMHTAKGYSLGAVDYILTPVVPEILRAKVRVFVQLHLMTREVQRQANQRIALVREQAARAAAEESSRRSMFLTEASKVLSTSLEVNATASSLTQCIVPFLADLAALVLIDDQGSPRRVEVTCERPSTGIPERASDSFAELDNPTLNGAMEHALASGKVQFLGENELNFAALTGKALTDNSAKTFDLGFALHTLAVLPLLARGRKLGALLIGEARSPLKQRSGTLTLAEELASRAAVSLDNCLLYARIQEADQRKNEFLAMLAHELRNPLAPVRNAVQLLSLPERNSARLDWAIEVIDRQTQQLVHLVDDLLDVARITQGRISLKLEPVDVAAVVAVAVETSRPLIESRRHKLKLALPPEPVCVYGDYSRIAQILSNLINNAAKYTEPGGHIDISATAYDSEVEFRVRDSGIGIPKEMLADIFELFTQAERSLDRSQGGLGVGLTIVDRLVQMQGGSVRAYSKGPRQGSEFIVRLPRSTISVVPARDAAPGRCGVRQVLVVDDYADSAESMAALLQMDGHEVRIAHDGVTALEMARQFKPSIVFLDIGLPGIDGFEVARMLRAEPETQHCVLVAVSGYGQPQDQQRSRETGFNHHLVKPVDPLALRQVLASLEASAASPPVAPLLVVNAKRSLHDESL